MTNTNENGWAEYSKLVLKELETLALGIKELNDSMHEMRREVRTKFKNWSSGRSESTKLLHRRK